MTESDAGRSAELHVGAAGDATAAFEKALHGEHDAIFVLQLYVTGMRPRSQRAIENIRHLCEEYLPGQYELRIIDIYQQPELAETAQIVAAPTLVKELPLPLRKLIGDMSDTGRVRVALGLESPNRTASPQGSLDASPPTTASAASNATPLS